MKSTLKTTAAVLRSIAQEKDLVWAEMLDRKVHTIRHLEAGTLKLSPGLAQKMNYETGISIKWLMDGNKDAPPVSQDGRKYTKAIFEEVQARKKSFAVVDDFAVGYNALQFFGQICAILLNANRKRNYHLAFYRTAKAILELRADFGAAREIDDHIKALAYALRPGTNIEDVVGFKYTPEFKPESKRPLKKRRRR
jgi:hypothetical protein